MGLSEKAMHQALEAREADCESKHLWALSTAWEIEASDRHKQFLLTLHKEEMEHFNWTADEVSFFEKVVERCSMKECEDNLDFNIGAYIQDLKTLSVVDECIDQLELAISHCKGEPPSNNETSDWLNAILVAAISVEWGDGANETNGDIDKAEEERVWQWWSSYLSK